MQTLVEGCKGCARARAQSCAIFTDAEPFHREKRCYAYTQDVQWAERAWAATVDYAASRGEAVPNKLREMYGLGAVS